MHRPTAPFERRLLARFSAGAGALLLLAALTWYFSLKAVDATRFVIHTHEVMGSVGQLQFHLYRAEAEQRGFLISRDVRYVDAFHEAVEAMSFELDRLGGLIDDNPTQRARVAVLRSEISHRIALLNTNLALTGAASVGRDPPNVARGSSVDRRIDQLLAQMLAMEQELLLHRQQLEAERAQATAFGFITLVVLMLIAVPLLYLRHRDNYRDKQAAERLLAERSRQIEQASRMKTEFLANMSHELRTPLNAIIGFSGVILDGLAGAVTTKVREYAHDIRDSGRHLLSLINDILDLSTIESGNMKLSPGITDVETLAASGLAIIREQAHARGIRLTHRCEGMPGRLWLDARKTRQIMVNLLSNAVKFSADGSEVTLTLRIAPRSRLAALESGAGRRTLPLAEPAHTDFIEISVRDHGIGIASADLSRLFEPFTQLDASHNRAHEGTGLGLALVRRLTELQSGALMVESSPGDGACFTVWLPLRRPPPDMPSSTEPLPEVLPVSPT